MPYVRPNGAYDGNTVTNRRKYQEDSVAVPKVAISSSKVDGDFNYLIDAVNELEQDIADISIGGIPDGSITTAKLADDAVTTVKVADSNITSVKIANNAVTTDKIADANVTNAKLAVEAVNTGNIINAAVTTAKIADGSITDAKLASGITSYPAGYINDTVTYVNNTQVTWEGICRDSTNSRVFNISSAETATLSGATANTTYNLFVAGNTLTDTPVVVWSGDVAPAGYTYYRRVLSIRTDGAGNIIPFTSFTLKDGSIKIVFNSSIGNNPNSQENSADFRLLATGCPQGITTTWQGLISANSFASTSGSNFCGVEVDTTLKATATGNSYFVFVSRLYGTKDNTTRVSDLVCVNGDIWYKGVNVNGGNHYVTQSGYIDERKV